MHQWLQPWRSGNRGLKAHGTREDRFFGATAPYSFSCLGAGQCTRALWQGALSGGGTCAGAPSSWQETCQGSDRLARAASAQYGRAKCDGQGARA